MIQLADGFDIRLQFLIVLQPLAHLRDLFAMHAELAGAATGIADGQNGLRMSFTAGALGAPAGVTGGSFDEGTSQEFAGGREAFEEPIASLDGLLVCHLYR